MSVVQNLPFTSPNTRGGSQARNTQLYINKQWVEVSYPFLATADTANIICLQSASNQWPTWTESHLIFLIQRFGLCSLSQEKINHLSVDTILQATTIYFDKTGWKSHHEERLWEKLNLKVGYLHAGLTGQRDQAMVDHHCKTRLYFHTMHKKNPSSFVSNKYSAPLSSPYRPQAIPTRTPAPEQPAAYRQSTGYTASQYVPEVKAHPREQAAMALWMSMSGNEQASFMYSQLQTAKSFTDLVAIVDRRCKYIQASGTRRTGHVSPTNTQHALEISTTNLNTDTNTDANNNTNTLHLETRLSPSAMINHKAQLSASSAGESTRSPDIIFDGLPSPIIIREDGHNYGTSLAKCSDKDKVLLKSKDEIQEINEDDFAEVVRSQGSIKSPTHSGLLDVKSIIDNCIRELKLKRKREKDTRKAGRSNSEQAEQKEELEEDEVAMIQTVEEVKSEGRRKRCKIQVVI